MLEKKYRNTRVRLEKEIIFLNIENWKTIKRKIKQNLINIVEFKYYIII